MFKLQTSLANDLYGYDYTGKQEENNEEERVDGEKS